MLSSINKALTGAEASLKRQDVAAHNTANLSTEGFSKETVVQSEGNTGGVVVHVEKSTRPGSQFPGPESTLIKASNMDLAETSVNQSIAALELKANLAVLKTAQKKEDSIIDLFV